MRAHLYRKKPVEVEAIEFDGKNAEEIFEFMGIKMIPTDGTGNSELEGKLLIQTLEGPMIASAGDFIIKGVNGEFYPCKPDIFRKTYQSVWE